MKFLCPSCKAKYQIADEKVAGRAVRMKCRKCGYVIPISEVPPAPPTVPPPEGGVALPPVPRLPPPPRGLDSSPSHSAPKIGAAPVPPPAAAPSPKPAVVRPAPASRPLAARPLAPTATPRPTGAGKAAVPAKPAISASTAAAEPATAAPSTSELLPAFEEEEEQPTAIVRGGGALAAAFGALVTKPRDSKPSAPQPAMTADEWYVGINDVPVGPIRLGDLRAKAASGAINGESLVWRDGIEDWRPLKSFPELVAVVEESLSSARAAGAPLSVPVYTAAKNEFGEFAAALPTGGTPSGVVTEDLAAAGLVRTRTPVAAWIAVAVALTCGLAIGYVVFSRQKPVETVIKYVDRPVPGAEQPVAAAPGASGSPAAAEEDTQAPGSKPRTTSRATGTKPVAAANGEDKGGLQGLKGLEGLRPGSPGPGSSPGSSTGSSSGGGQLDATQIQSTVSRYTGSVKRSCWQPALDSRDPTAPATARVQVAITVGPSGAVQKVSTNGDPRGYPGLSSCIAGRVRGWQFPATGGTTVANVPFVFAAQ